MGGSTKNEEERQATSAADGGAAGAAAASITKGAPESSKDVAAAAVSTEPSSSDESQSRRVYVGNLSWEVSWQDLKDLMKTTGHEVTHSDIMRSHDGRSKGCGIVEFATAEGAKQAVLTLNDKELKGRQIFVREDREGRSASSSSGGGGGGGGNGGNHHHQHHQHRSGGGGGGGVSGGGGHHFSSGEQAQSRRVYVGNVSWDVNWPILKDHMRQAGEVVHAEVICEQNGRSKGCGIVEYATEEEAQEAVATLTHTELNGRMIFVREDRETSSAGGGPGSSSVSSNRSNQNTSVYVWNLSYETSWQDLKDHMRKAGNVDQVTILTSDGNSVGSGIVVYQKPTEAARAIRELQDSELNGRPIKLREDRAQFGGRGGWGRGGRGRFGGRGGGAFRGGGGGGGGGRGSYQGGSDATATTRSASSGTQLFVGNLSYDTNWRDLKDLFKQCGEVDRADVKKGFGTVRFTKKEDAERAMSQLNGVELDGRALEVRLDQKG